MEWASDPRRGDNDGRPASRLPTPRDPQRLGPTQGLQGACHGWQAPAAVTRHPPGHSSASGPAGLSWSQVGGWERPGGAHSAGTPSSLRKGLTREDKGLTSEKALDQPFVTMYPSSAMRSRAEEERPSPTRRRNRCHLLPPPGSSSSHRLPRPMVDDCRNSVWPVRGRNVIQP